MLSEAKKELQYGFLEGLVIGILVVSALILGVSRSSGEAETKGVSPALIRYLSLYALFEGLRVLAFGAIVLGIVAYASYRLQREREMAMAIRLIGVLIGISIIVRIIAP